MKKTRFVFFGTPHLATLVLDELESAGFVPALVITAPDTQSGRGLALNSSPVKKWSLERDIDVLTPEKLKSEEVLGMLGNTDWDVFIVAMYAKLIPKVLLDMPKKGVLNVHPSLLPKFRGPSPVLSAILKDERTTGVSIMELSVGMDEGPVLAQAKIELEPETNTTSGWPPKGSEFEMLLAQEGGKLLAEVLPLWLEQKIEAVPQDASVATYTQKFSSEDACIDLHADPRENYLKIRAFDKHPRAYMLSSEGKRILITEAVFENNELSIVKVIPEGKKEMLYAEYTRGLR